jgi:hypothetical protein
MSKYFAPNNKESAKDLFQKRLYYWAYATDKSPQNVINFSYGEKALYGRVGRSMQPIVLKEGTLKFLKNPFRPEETSRSLNFVADIFNDMSRQFEKKAVMSQIATNDPYLSKLVVYKSYISPRKLYSDHQEEYIAQIAKLFKSQKMYFSNFEEFLDLLTPVLQYTCKTTRFTYPGFVKSTDCSIMSTGLAIEIADLKYNNDEEKAKQFLQSKNWDFYVSTCNSYGFMVDLNIPWRIVADLESDSMKEIAERYGYYGTDSLFRKAYNNPNFLDIRKFTDMLLALYSACKFPFYDELENCGNGKIHVKKIYPKHYRSARELTRTFSGKKIFQFYTYLRLFEEKPELTQPEMDEIAAEVVSLVEAGGGMAVLTVYLEGIINKEFDKVGSVSYIKRANELREEMEIMRTENPTNPSNYRYADIAAKEKSEQGGTLIPEDLLPEDEQDILV